MFLDFCYMSLRRIKPKLVNVSSLQLLQSVLIDFTVRLKLRNTDLLYKCLLKNEGESVKLWNWLFSLSKISCSWRAACFLKHFHHAVNWQSSKWNFSFIKESKIFFSLEKNRCIKFQNVCFIRNLLYITVLVSLKCFIFW